MLRVPDDVQIEYRGVEQLVACRAHNPKVGGSNPPSATTRNPEAKQFQGFNLEQ